MGFRATLTSQDYCIDWPQWFRDEYKTLLVGPSDGLLLASTYEVKIYNHPDLAMHIHEALTEVDPDLFPFTYVWLHECGGITRTTVYADGESAVEEPTGWVRLDDDSNGTHNYGCEYPCIR